MRDKRKFKPFFWVSFCYSAFNSSSMFRIGCDHSFQFPNIFRQNLTTLLSLIEAKKNEHDCFAIFEMNTSARPDLLQSEIAYSDVILYATLHHV